MALNKNDILELPDAPDFISEPPKIPLDELILLCERELPAWNKIRYSKPLPEFMGEPFEI